MPKSICVFCSSSNEVDRVYFDLAEDLGRRIVDAGYDLVWGGGDIGLMGALARAAQQQGGKVIGVIPESMADREIAYRQADELIVTADMRQRKQIMEQRAGAFIALPGGFGTLEELLEIVTLRLLGYHDKPVVLINADGFYDGLLAFIDHLYAQRFAREKQRKHLLISQSVDGAMSLIEDAYPRVENKRSVVR